VAVGRHANSRDRHATGAVPPTLQQWLTRQHRARTLRQLQRQLDTFRGYDNTVRPHRALGRTTPAVAYHAPTQSNPHHPRSSAVPARFELWLVVLGGVEVEFSE
jgi:hypothetical protein